MLAIILNSSSYRELEALTVMSAYKRLAGGSFASTMGCSTGASCRDAENG